MQRALLLAFAAVVMVLAVSATCWLLTAAAEPFRIAHPAHAEATR